MADVKFNVSVSVEKMLEAFRQEGYTVQKWIPCSESFPHGGRVLATTKQGYVVDVIFVLKGSQWFRNGEYFPTDTVIAWMPIPDAYELPESGAQDEAKP